MNEAGLNGYAQSLGLTPDGLGGFYDAYGDYYEYDGLNGGFFKKSFKFVTKNVKSAVKDTVKITAKIAPLAKTALSFFPMGGAIGGVLDKVINVAEKVTKVGEFASTPQQAEAIQETVAPVMTATEQQIIQALPYVQPAPTNAQVATIAKITNIPQQDLQAEANAIKQANVKLVENAVTNGVNPATAPTAKTGMSTTTMALIGVGAVAVIGGGIYLAKK